MTPTPALRPWLRLALCALLLGAAGGPALAESSASSLVSDSLSTSVGSLSTSVGKSSDSSSKGKDVAQGDYRVVEVAAAGPREAREGQLRVQLQALADDSAEGTLFLTLPREAAERGRLKVGAVVTATTRPYGVEFAAGHKQDQRQAFFLALHDDWYRELSSKPVLL